MTVFLTGFPGFLGSELLPGILRARDGCTVTCLVQPAHAERARRRVEYLEMSEPGLRGRVKLVEGDITRADLGLGASVHRFASEVTEVFHLGAVYDLGVRREVGMRVNLYGTRHVLEFAETCPDLNRFHYVSTCYVSGRHPGIFGEDDLDRGQTFNNYYEETKYLAEREVRERMRAGVPSTVYRPAIVVGDSETGVTAKYDGPYMLLRWMLKQRRIALVPVFKGVGESRLNLVPIDFVVAAIEFLSALPHSAGRTYQLADPDPLTVEETIEVLSAACGRKVAKLGVRKGLVESAIRRVPGVERLTGIQPEALDYFDHPTHYSVQNALTDLQGSGISVPRLDSYVDVLVSYVRAHPEVSSRPMV